MIRDSHADGNDGSLLEGFTMDDIDVETLRSYRIQFKTLFYDHAWNGVDDKTFLKNLGGYEVDRKTGKEGLTVAGLLMFGKGLSINERFANFRMDYLDMSHLIGEQRYRDRLTDDGRWENNLYQFFHIVMPKLTFDLPRPFQMEGIQRIEETLQIKAVREAFINAIIHSDVFLNSGILRIEKHDDRLCLRNPGTLLLPIEEIYEGGHSKSRNPRMQKMFRLIGYGENIGSGFPKILHAWKQVGWKEPMLENKLALEEVVLTLYVPEVVDSEGGQKGGQKGEPTLVEMVLKYIEDTPTITRKRLVELTGKAPSAIQKCIQKLKEENRIKRIGGDRGDHWEVLK